MPRVLGGMKQFARGDLSKRGRFTLLLVYLRVRFQALLEWIYFDSSVGRMILGGTSMMAGVALLALGNRNRGAEALATSHRANFHPVVNGMVEGLFRQAITQNGGVLARALNKAVRDYPTSVGADIRTTRFFKDPALLFGGCCLVVKSASANERGVLCVYYSYVYPLLLKRFDATAIEERYHLVIQPSWSGYCDLNILCLSRLRKPIFVESIEPRDTEFLCRVGARFVVVPVGANTWTDPDVFKPLHGVNKDIDVVYVAAWAPYKRHWAIFKALSIMKSRGVRPRVVLVGYRATLSAKEIFDQACVFRVEDLIEFYEDLQPNEVNLLLNRSKVHILWSRREGVNRAIVESMAAGTPCIVRSGFNYGFHYPYINERTGCFAEEEELPVVLAKMIEGYNTFQPRDTVVPAMTPQASTRRLNDAIRATALSLGETWTRDVVLRYGTIHGLQYRRPEDRERFAADYEYLKSCILD
jgi:glycosyltransferase involved in cell wall biosynthesis